MFDNRNLQALNKFNENIINQLKLKLKTLNNQKKEQDMLASKFKIQQELLSQSLYIQKN